MMSLAAGTAKEIFVRNLQQESTVSTVDGLSVRQFVAGDEKTSEFSGLAWIETIEWE